MNRALHLAGGTSSEFVLCRTDRCRATCGVNAMDINPLLPLVSPAGGKL
jgi:hypothetical protein